jgi:hypothetical protein
MIYAYADQARSYISAIEADELEAARAKLPQGYAFLWETHSRAHWTDADFRQAMLALLDMKGYEETIYPVMKSFTLWSSGKSGYSVDEVAVAIEFLRKRGFPLPMQLNQVS